MQTDHAFNALNERFERLVLQRSESTLSPDYLRRISDKFANKSLQELNEIALQLAQASK